MTAQCRYLGVPSSPLLSDIRTAPPLHYTSLSHVDAHYSTRVPYDHQSSYMNYGPAPPLQHTYTQPHHGTKRSAPDDEVEQSANISTHFKKLRLNNAQLPNSNSKPPVGVTFTSNQNQIDHQRPEDCDDTSDGHSSHAAARNLTISSDINPPSLDNEDFMPIDETPNRIYIHSIEDEIAQIEAAEQTAKQTLFLPEFDKSVSKIPQYDLQDHLDRFTRRNDNSQALILYRDPSSISMPPEEDAVRKAIIAARREARQKMIRDHETACRREEDQSAPTDHSMESTAYHTDANAAAMNHINHNYDDHDENMDIDDVMDIE